MKLSNTGPRDCRWVLYINRREPKVCGARTHKHSSWCEKHYNIVFLPNTRPTKKSKIVWKIGY